MKQSKTLASGFPVMLDEERAKYVAREVKYEETIAELRQQLAEKDAEIERIKADREGLVCGDCDGSGWLQNRVEGRHPCTCMTEAEPYQILKEQLAEKDAEIERLKTVPMKYRRMEFNAQLQRENDDLRQQLAASQAREQQLRDELFAVLVQDMPDFKARLKVYAIPADTTALEALIAKAGEVMRERCRKVAFDMAYADSMAVDVSQTIRALPGVTLEDIK